jgi:17beta-estradiol 17-dehydrogenase / very-long-chain 3-oxoacyl-CoA reductase
MGFNWSSVWRFVACSVLIYPAARLINRFFRSRPRFDKYVSTDESDQSWALVTGASDGIGRAFAFELCSRGVNVIIHGRNEEKLLKMKKELLEKYSNRRVEISVIDAAVYDNDAALTSLVEMCRRLPQGRLRILINNVGGSNNLIGNTNLRNVADTSIGQVDTLINVNVRFPTRLTTALLPLLTSSNHPPSLIINIGSIAGIFSIPYTVIYGACKSFNLSFSESLAAELTALGHAQQVEVLGITVGSVDTPGAPKEDNEGPFIVSPQEMVRGALNCVGYRRRIVFSNWQHALTAKMISVLPESMLIKQLNANMKKQQKRT